MLPIMWIWVYLESKAIMKACANSYIEHVVGRFGIYKRLQWVSIVISPFEV